MCNCNHVTDISVAPKENVIMRMASIILEWVEETTHRVSFMDNGKGVCRWPGCAKAAKPGAVYCASHLQGS